MKNQSTTVMSLSRNNGGTNYIMEKDRSTHVSAFEMHLCTQEKYTMALMAPSRIKKVLFSERLRTERQTEGNVDLRANVSLISHVTWDQ